MSGSQFCSPWAARNFCPKVHITAIPERLDSYTVTHNWEFSEPVPPYVEVYLSITLQTAQCALFHYTVRKTVSPMVFSSTWLTVHIVHPHWSFCEDQRIIAPSQFICFFFVQYVCLLSVWQPSAPVSVGLVSAQPHNQDRKTIFPSQP